MRLLDLTLATFETEQSTAWWWSALCKRAFLLLSAAHDESIDISADEIFTSARRRIHVWLRVGDGTVLPILTIFL